MKLVPTMFYDPEPEDVLPIMTRQGPCPKQNPLHIEWKRRQVKPEKESYLSFQEFCNVDHPNWKKWRGDYDYYESNRLRYSNAESCGNNLIKISWFVFDNDPHCAYVEILILTMSITMADGSLLYHGNILETETFELICKENGIKLEIL